MFGLELRFRLITGKEGEVGLVKPLRDIEDPLCLGNNPNPSDVALLT
jgi:hypothetical protein